VSHRCGASCLKHFLRWIFAIWNSCLA